MGLLFTSYTGNELETEKSAYSIIVIKKLKKPFQKRFKTHIYLKLCNNIVLTKKFSLKPMTPTKERRR